MLQKSRDTFSKVWNVKAFFSGTIKDAVSCEKGYYLRLNNGVFLNLHLFHSYWDILAFVLLLLL
jgi:hypothetical protein